MVDFPIPASVGESVLIVDATDKQRSVSVVDMGNGTNGLVVSGSGGGGGSNASVGTTGATAPTSATEVAYINSTTGYLTPASTTAPFPFSGYGVYNSIAPTYTSGSVAAFQTDASGNLKISLANGEFENEEFIDDYGVIFIYRDVGTATTGPVFQAFTVPAGLAYTPGPNPRPIFDNMKMTVSFLPAFPLSVQSAVIAAGGTGYKIFDFVTVSGGTSNSPAIGVVTQVNGGVVTQISFAKPGSYIGQYSTVPTSPAATTGGSGTGLTLTLTTITGVAFQVDTTGYATLQWAGTNILSQGGLVEGSIDGITWKNVPFLSGVNQTFYAGVANSVNSGDINWVSSVTPFVRFRYGGTTPTGTCNFAYAQRETPFAPAVESVSQGPNQGSNNFWYAQIQAANTGAPKTYATIISAATTNATLLSSTVLKLFHIILANNSTTWAYLKLFNKSTAPVPGTDTPYAVYGIPPSGLLTISPESMGMQPPNTSLGIGYAITTNPALNDATALAAAGTIVGSFLSI